ncbi:MAG: hypothetical protein JNM78_20300 [Cyclobacteriaceae bacterium]|nr:hypothetical protein [Cyclobacteriaceae bacterium]
MKLSFLAPINQNKSLLGLSFVFIVSLFSGYSNPSFSKTPVKVRTEWVSLKKEIKENDHSNEQASTKPVHSTFPLGSNLFSELFQKRVALLKCKNNPGISLILITPILSSRNLPQSEDEDSHAS